MGHAKRFAQGVEDFIVQKVPGYSLPRGISASLSAEDAGTYATLPYSLAPANAL